MSSPHNGKVDVGSRINTVNTNERVHGHPNYFEKDGLRTYGDGEDHDHEPSEVYRHTSTAILEEQIGGFGSYVICESDTQGNNDQG
ncbi:MAG: hypothetical protein LQ351_002073 [Letrouitia transgressa]|nr:MAG: hypothetical protein LQ351_002073 [Letrouitia transgressa]